ncbi:MAG: DNA/RNA helicase domain-containing protein [Bacillota bacterium]
MSTKSKSCTFLKNSYRVLLTRVRQGMVIFIPK